MDFICLDTPQSLFQSSTIFQTAFFIPTTTISAFSFPFTPLRRTIRPFPGHNCAHVFCKARKPKLQNKHFKLVSYWNHYNHPAKILENSLASKLKNLLFDFSMISNTYQNMHVWNFYLYHFTFFKQRCYKNVTKMRFYHWLKTLPFPSIKTSTYKNKLFFKIFELC